MPEALGPNERGPDPSRDPDQQMNRFLGESGEHAGWVKNTLAMNLYDAHLFSGLLAGDETLKALARLPQPPAPKTFQSLLFDLFLLYFKFVPEFVAEEETDPAHRKANRPILKRLLADEETAIARLSTATDPAASALAAAQAARQILDELRRRPDLANWAERQSQDRQDSPQAPPQAPPSAGPAPEPPEARPEPSVAPRAHGQEVPDDRRPTHQIDDPAPARDLGAAARAAAEAASSEAQAHAGALASWGLKPADLATAPLDERLTLARALRTRRMRDLADLLGRTSNQRSSMRRRKVKANRDEIHGVTTSGDPSRVLSSEMAQAFGTQQPNRTLDFFRRLSERAVPSYSLRAQEPVGRGPIVALIDSSYSMKGEPMAWASAVALTLARAAGGGANSHSGSRSGSHSGARRVRAVFFNAKIVLDVEISPGERDVRKFLAIGTVEANGGTRYEPPLLRALELFSSGDDLKDADVLLVTDGLCEIQDTDLTARLTNAKARLGFGLVCVLVGENSAPGTLEPHADTMVRAADLARASGARDAAAQIFDAL